MPTSPLSSFLHFCIFQVPTCRHTYYLPAPICVANHFPYSANLFVGALNSIRILMLLTQIQNGEFGGELCSPSKECDATSSMLIFTTGYALYQYKCANCITATTYAMLKDRKIMPGKMSDMSITTDSITFF